MAENVTAFVLEVGLKDALDILGEDVWNNAKLTFKEWEWQYVVGYDHDSKLQKKVLAKMAETATAYEDFFRILKSMPEKKEWVTEKLQGLLASTTDFDQVYKWRPISELPQIDKDRVQRMAELANCAKHWSLVSSNAECNPRAKSAKLVALALVKMVECATKSGKVEDWEIVHFEAERGSDERKKALQNIFLLTNKEDRTFDTWYHIWLKSREEDGELEQFARSKVMNYATTFHQWFLIYENIDEGSSEKELCLNELLLKAENVEEWKKLWRNAPEGSGAKRKALQRLKDCVAKK